MSRRGGGWSISRGPMGCRSFCTTRSIHWRRPPPDAMLRRKPCVTSKRTMTPDGSVAFRLTEPQSENMPAACRKPHHEAGHTTAPDHKPRTSQNRLHSKGRPHTVRQALGCGLILHRACRPASEFAGGLPGSTKTSIGWRCVDRREYPESRSLMAQPTVGVGRMFSRRGLWPRVFIPARGSEMLRRSMDCGSQPWGREPLTSRLAALGRMATARASTPNFGTSASVIGVWLSSSVDPFLAPSGVMLLSAVGTLARRTMLVEGEADHAKRRACGFARSCSPDTVRPSPHPRR